MPTEAGIERLPFNGGLTSGYISRGAGVVPRIGDQAPWNSGGGNYIQDYVNLSLRAFSTQDLEMEKNNKKHL